MSKVKQKKSSKKLFFGFENFYNNLVELANIFNKSDNSKRIKMIGDLLFLIVVTCVLKIPFIFVRNIGDNLVDLLFNNNINALVIWGLIIELFYVVIALSFFMKTLKKWIKTID